MTDDLTTPAEPDNFKALNIVHKAQMVGQLVFMIVSLYLVSTGFTDKNNVLASPLLIIVGILGVVGIIFGNNLFQKKVEQVRAMDATDSAKLNAYRGAYIIRWAMLQAPGLFSIISFLITGDYAFAGIWLVLIVLFVTAGPSRSKMDDDLDSEDDVTDLKG
jgi:hypothetical protein